MKIFTLQRTSQNSLGTFGTWTEQGGDYEAVTVERPWLNNSPFLSCIPAAVYPLRPYQSTRFGPVWEVCTVPGRDHILIHPANLPEDLEGCIGQGQTMGVLNGQKAILNSVAQMQKFHRLMAGETEAQLIVLDVPPTEEVV